MDTAALKKFAQGARRQLLEQVAVRMEQVLQTDSIEIREKKNAVKELQVQIRESSQEAVIDRVAYTWFNRFCALRYMDVNHYTPLGIVSPVAGFTQPEILQEAKQGVIDDSFKVDKQRVFGLLNDQLPSSNPQQEAYRLLLVGACNAYHAQMPFLFPKIEDYTELLMPDDLLSENSVLQGVRETLTLEDCKDVEVIGWLYQYYISERKDEVFTALKMNKKIEAEDIPAATQLFTPHWIVRYLVENSLGRLWMLNHPDSRLVEQMDYYIKPVQEETDYLEISSPEEIKICDPACGSGHMLIYAYDLLYSIYEEQGYDPVQISSLILENNLYGIEIDKRAGELSAFSLMMKAREKDRRFFNRGVTPNICVLESIVFTNSELETYIESMGRDLFSEQLQVTMNKFVHADNFGSLIQPQVENTAFVQSQLESKGILGDLLIYNTNKKVSQVLSQTEYLRPKYHVVVTNPPYMGSKGMNLTLKDFAKNNYPNSWTDLFSMFIERGFQLTLNHGYNALVTMHTWMFIPSHEKLRLELFQMSTIKCMVHMASMVMGIAFGTAATIWQKIHLPDAKGHFSFVDYEDLTSEYFPKTFPVINQRLNSVSTEDFMKIPGSPVSYWATDHVRELFNEGEWFRSIAEPKQGLITGDNERFLRYWYEVPFRNIGFGYSSRIEAKRSQLKWFPFNKGGDFRKWFGNNEYVVNWEGDGEEIRNHFDAEGNLRSRPQNLDYYFKESITWSKYSAANYFGVRYSPPGFIFSDAGSAIFPNYDIFDTFGFLVSKICSYLLKIKNPTLTFQLGDISILPFNKSNLTKIHKEQSELIPRGIDLVKSDWDSQEISWDFASCPLILQHISRSNLKNSYKIMRTQWHKFTQELLQIENRNNQIFVEAYGLQNEIKPEVKLHEITLTFNPHHRYPDTSVRTYTNEEREAMLLKETLHEFISYAVGCMFGRYSLDKPGLILTNSGETKQDFLQHVPQPSFPPDEDNVIPLLESEWFEDDIAERFKDFLKVTFGIENFDENLDFLEGAIGKDIRSYFVKDFYKEHVKMYKKRPIYWLFSSPNGSFNALIYMHRYRPDTISVILNDYLRQYRDKLMAHQAHQEAIERNPSASQREVTKATKEIIQINKVLVELKEYEDEILYPLATQKIEIDLDDGVLVNYNKFGKALKKVPGLSA